MSDPLRDQIPYFRTWLTLTDTGMNSLNKHQASDVPELEKKLASAKRCLTEAKELKCYDLREEFADITIQIQDKLEAAKKKLELMQ